MLNKMGFQILIALLVDILDLINRNSYWSDQTLIAKKA